MDNASEVVTPQVKGVPQVSVTLNWGQAAEMEPLHVNQDMMQVGNPTPDGTPDGIYLILGDFPPPIVSGADEASLRQEAEKISGSTIPITVRGRFHMSRGFVDKLIGDLQRVAEAYDSLASGSQGKAGVAAP